MTSGPSSVPLISPEAQRIKDAEHLKLLAIFHYIFGGFAALGSCFALIHVLMGLAMLAGGGEAAMVGLIFTIVGASVLLLGLTFGGLVAFSGRMIQMRQRPLFSKIMATFCCCSLPFGTALGICTWLVLTRPSVKALYDKTPQALPPPPVLVDEHEESVWKDMEKRQSEPGPIISSGSSAETGADSNKPSSEPDASA